MKDQETGRNKKDYKIERVVERERKRESVCVREGYVEVESATDLGMTGAKATVVWRRMGRHREGKKETERDRTRQRECERERDRWGNE